MGDMRAVIKVSYEKNTAKAKAHLKYIGFRSQEMDKGYESENKGFFDNTRDTGANYNDFHKSIEQDKALSHSNSVKMHKMVISFRGEDFNKLNLSEEKLKDMTRSVMRKLEQEKGMKLEWVGAVHMVGSHPHVHVAIKSVGRDNQENAKRLKIDFKTDLPGLKNEIDKFTGREQVIEMEKSLGKGEPARNDKDLIQECSNIINNLAREGEREIETAQRKAQNQAKRQADRERDERGR